MGKDAGSAMTCAVPNYSSLALPIAPESSLVRTLYARRHRDNAGDGDDNTLFIANLPPGCTSSVLRGGFGVIGTGTDVKIFAVGDNGPAHVAHVSFEDDQCVQKALEYDGTMLPSGLTDLMVPTDMEGWVAEHKIRDNVPTPALQAAVDHFMATYETKEESQRAAWAVARGQEDEDGFTKVVSKNQKRVLKEGGTGGGKRKRGKKKELTDFYVWQTRETKRQRIADLRESFEDDKKRIAKLKAARKFK